MRLHDEDGGVGEREVSKEDGSLETLFEVAISRYIVFCVGAHWVEPLSIVRCPLGGTTG